MEHEAQNYFSRWRPLHNSIHGLKSSCHRTHAADLCACPCRCPCWRWTFWQASPPELPYRSYDTSYLKHQLLTLHGNMIWKVPTSKAKKKPTKGCKFHTLFSNRDGDISFFSFNTAWLLIGRYIIFFTFKQIYTAFFMVLRN